MSLLDDIKAAVFAGDAGKVREASSGALADGISPATIINDGLIAGMNDIGVLFKNNEVYVPEVLIAAMAMHAGMDLLKPLLKAGEIEDRGTVLIGTVKGDLHDIGKNLVAMMVEGNGYRVIDLGIDVAPDRFIKAVDEHRPQAVGLSALLTTTMPAMEETVSKLKIHNSQIKVIVGGAPITQAYADHIGADAYAPDAGSAVEVINQLLAG
jgi:5-methyltetrahydrofolate--homocysteine methyltransferase